MSDLDPAAADALRILLSAGVGALAGGLVAEWRTQAAEKRASERETAVEQRAHERDAKLLRRDQMLRRISDTQRDIQGQLTWHMMRALGATEKMLEVRYGQEHYPDANIYLVGDEELLRQFIDFTNELAARAPGSGLSDHDTARIGALLGHISARLDLQRDRVSRGLAPVWPSSAFVQDMVDRMGDRFGIPPEYRPKINPDAVEPPL